MSKLFVKLPSYDCNTFNLVGAFESAKHYALMIGVADTALNLQVYSSSTNDRIN